MSSKTKIPADTKPSGDEIKKNISQADEEWYTNPEFIYGGPFVKVEKPSPFLNIATPYNVQLQGTFKKSFAYYSLKERIPVILTKVIDYCARKGGGDQYRSFIQHVTKLKNDLVTNKPYEPLTVDTPEARRWNSWIEACDNKRYFTNTWVFTECYIYRKLWEGCEINKGLENFDYFDEQKHKAFESTVEFMCIVAEKVVTMLPESEKDKRKADLQTLLKLCLWANKCDLSLSSGEQVSLMKSEPGAPLKESLPLLDPFQMIVDLKDKLLVDDTGKAADQIFAKAESMAKNIEGPPEEAPAPPPAEGEKPEGEQQPKIPCPAKMTLPQTVNFDIVCDNAGYELFADLCVAHFLIAQKVVQKVRFHVKKIPWFVSDVTPQDFKYVINACKNATYTRTVAAPVPVVKEGEEPPEPGAPTVIDSASLRQLGETWDKFLEDGTFILLSDDYWTSPHVYKDMKKYDPSLYRKLQYTVTIMFKGDLNYRKLLGEKNCNPYLGFEPALQGFIPAPILAVRTVKADLICGLPKGKAEQLRKIDEKWMEKGDYGVIQYCGKAEPLKVSDRPCDHFPDHCRGLECPHTTYL